jgi:hypothetical protein
MNLKIKAIAFLLGLIFLGVVLRCVRQNTLRPLYAVLWISLSCFLLSIAVLEPFYKWLATSVIGIYDARHVIYVAVIGFLLVYCLYLTVMVSRMSNQISHLITAVAILDSNNASEPVLKPQTGQPAHPPAPADNPQAARYPANTPSDRT